MTADSTEAKPKEPLAILTQIALVIVLAVCATRVTMSETLRDVFNPGTVPGADAAIGPGATTTVLLDLLCWAPVLLILIRRAIDRAYVLRWQASHVLLLALSGWVVASTFWASDRFAACVNASTWCAGFAVLWSMSQLVRSWTRVRLVLSLAVALSAIFVAQAAIYKFIEGPELQDQWKSMRDQVFEQNHWSPNDFAAKQFEMKVMHAELMGFYKSPNTFAAIAALCAFITAGFAWQRRQDNDPAGFTVALAVPVVLTIPVLIGTASRTAEAGAVLCAGVLVVAWRCRGFLAAHARAMFAVACALAAAGAAVVIGIGIKTGGLIHDSLNFRWNYWVAAWDLHRVHPWIGVGWSNFGNAYLGHRLPVATEEVKDPHNFIVKFLAETGIVGALLVIAWVARFFREMTRPIAPRRISSQTGLLGLVSAVVGGYALLRVVSMAPLSLLPTEILKLLLFTALILLGMAIAAVRGSTDRAADDRPAPFLLYATIVGLGGFVLHNLVDFAMFETGPWLVMMLIVGCVLGARHISVAGKRTHTWAALGGLAVVFLGLLVYVGLLIVPLATAEAKATAGDAAGREGRLTDAVSLFREAIAASPVPNSDYPLRAIRWMTGLPSNDVLGM
ncbi:MAG: O-antigen ligase family protein, partial [Tepidisphaeraceae bacterium]